MEMMKRWASNMATRTPIRSAFKGSLSGKCIILKYHHVPRVETKGWYAFEQGVPAAIFRNQMEFVRKHCKVIALPDLLEHDSSDDDSRPTVVITLDDGYLDNYAYAFPVLQELGLTATFFLATAYLETGITYPKNRVKALFRADSQRTEQKAAGDLGISREPQETDEAYVGRVGNGVITGRDSAETVAILESWEHLIGDTATALAVFEVMGWAEVHELVGSGMTIGAHTIHHRRLEGLDRAEVVAEVRGGREQLESQLGSPITCFAYPDGRRDDVSRAVVAEEFEIVCTSEPGLVTLPPRDPHDLRRASVTSDTVRFRALVSGLSAWWGATKHRIGR